MASEAPNGTGSLPVPGVGARAADPSRADRPFAGEIEDALPLRLALTRGALGIELSRPVRFGPLEVGELTLSLPGLRYPLDLSKGVKQFRSRRGRLERLLVHVSLAELGGWLETRLRDILAEPLSGVRVWSLSLSGGSTAPVTGEIGGLGVGIHSASRSLAFDLLWCPEDEPRFVIDSVRAIGVECSALELALRAVDAVLGVFGPTAQQTSFPIERHGRVLVLRDAPLALCRRVLPDVGCRVPATEHVRAGALEVQEGWVTLGFDAEALATDVSPAVLLALEAAYRLRAADDLVARGEKDAARQMLLEVIGETIGLTSALLGLADLDAATPGRQEAALATLEELGGAEQAGALGALALLVAGQTERGCESLVRTATHEVFGPFAAQLFCRAAELVEQPAKRLSLLDRAVARAPGLLEARWLRFEERLSRSDVEGALSDAQHLEAASSGVSQRHGLCLRIGRRLAEAGHAELARRFLERAQRYAPDDPATRAALGRLLASLGYRTRAALLLQSALQSERFAEALVKDSERGELLLDLGRLLGEGLGDYPQGIARLRQVSARSVSATAARALEAQYCQRLGDLGGASRAYVRLREAVELGWAGGPEVVEVLRSGAAFEESRGELQMAERHLYAALSLAPSDETLQEEYRRVAALAQGGVRLSGGEEGEQSSEG